MRRLIQSSWSPAPIRLTLFCASLIAFGGCSLIPHEGPSQKQVESTSEGPAGFSYALVKLDRATAATVGQFYSATPPKVSAPLPGAAPIDRIGLGDRLQILLWEAGQGGLFSSSNNDTSGSLQGAQRTLDLTAYVDLQGVISIPYAGRITVAGLTPLEVEAAIINRLKGQTFQPQVSVQVVENIANTVMVQGDVARPGRYPLSPAGYRLLDLMATAGGQTSPIAEVMLRITRGDSSVTIPLADVIADPAKNILMSPGDTILSLRQPAYFYAFGAVNRAGLQRFDEPRLTLLNALGKVAGIQDQRAAAEGVFIFRYEPRALARQLAAPIAVEKPEAEDRSDLPIAYQPILQKTTEPVPASKDSESKDLEWKDTELAPVVYQLDMRNPNTFFVLNTFPVQASDIIYVANAPVAEFSKFATIVTGLTSTAATTATPVLLFSQ